MTQDDPQHSILEIKIEANKVVVVCTCGWESPKSDDETIARAAYQTHQERP